MKQNRWKNRLMMLVVGLMLVGLTGVARGSIQFTATELGTGPGYEEWQYTYLVINDYSATDYIVGFNIAFTPEYTLVDPAGPTGWLVDTATGSFIAAIDTSNGIAPGDSLGGFQITFQYTGSPGGVPANQSVTGDLSGGGTFTDVTVPEPATYILLTLALLLVAGCQVILKRLRGI